MLYYNIHYYYVSSEYLFSKVQFTSVWDIINVRIIVIIVIIITMLGIRIVVYRGRRCCGAGTRFRKRPVWCADGETDAFLFWLLRHHHSGRSTRRYYYFRPFGQHNTYTRARTRSHSYTHTHIHTHTHKRALAKRHTHTHTLKPIRNPYDRNARSCLLCACA